MYNTYMTQITNITTNAKTERMCVAFLQIENAAKKLLLQPYGTTSSMQSVLHTIGSMGNLIPTLHTKADVTVINIPMSTQRKQHIIITKNITEAIGDVSLFIENNQSKPDSQNLVYVHIPNDPNKSATLQIIRKKIQMAENFTVQSSQVWSEHMPDEWFEHFELIAEKIWNSLQNIHI